jgi:hypothetical protein
MKPLLVLLGAFGILLLFTKILLGNFEFALSGRIAMSVMLAFTAVAHFAFARGMAMSYPALFRTKPELFI